MSDYPLHDFTIKSEVTNGLETIAYRKCVNCGSVMFEKNENPYYNLACPSPKSDWAKRESLRKKLEAAK